MSESKRVAGAAVVAFPLHAKSIYVIARKLVDIMSNLAEKTILISGNIPTGSNFSSATSIHDVGQTLADLVSGQGFAWNIVKWAIHNVWIQWLIAARLVRTRRDYQAAVFFLGTQYQIPILVCKAIGKRVICGSAGLGGDFAKYNFGPMAAAVALLLVNFNYWLADVILIESWHLAKDKTLNRWRRKLRLGTLHLADPHLFMQTTEIAGREPTIGFVGRFSPEKGVMKIVEALPHLLKRIPEAKGYFIGDGPLLEALKRRIAELGVENAVTIVGWVNHCDLPDLLNQMRLLVVPSESEGVPNVILEAFACGTVVAAAPVGGIRDLIEDGRTGFLLTDTGPRQLAEAIAEKLSDVPALERIAQSAHARLEEDYLLPSAVGRYRKIIAELEGCRGRDGQQK